MDLAGTCQESFQNNVCMQTRISDLERARKDFLEEKRRMAQITNLDRTLSHRSELLQEIRRQNLK